jgi:uncharacterized FlaG/YvyC family protein
MLGLPYYSHIKKDINRIMSISAHAQHFLHVKAFSLKEIVNLMHYSMDIFNILLIDDPLFNFTKRTFDDALSMVTALMKRNSQSFSELQLQSNYTTLKDQDLTPQQRQKKWLDQLRYMASPVLHATQKKIDEIISEINVPANISYDRTLENTGISIQTTFTSLTDVERLTTALTDGIVKEQLKHVMDLT